MHNLGLGEGTGFEFTVPADATPRTLWVYVSVFDGVGRFEAELSDGSAPLAVQTVDSPGTAAFRVYTVRFTAAREDAHLTVRHVLEKRYSSYGNVTLQAAALSLTDRPAHRQRAKAAGQIQAATAAPPPAPARFAFKDGTLQVTLTALAPGRHQVDVAYEDPATGTVLAREGSSVDVAGATATLEQQVRADPGSYRVRLLVDGEELATWHLVVPGVSREGAEVRVNGRPLSGFMWTWMPLDWQSRREDGRFADINVHSLLTPVELGGYGFNVVFVHDPERLRQGDFEDLQAAGGWAMVRLTGWQGLQPWGPLDWHDGMEWEPMEGPDGMPAAKSFDSPRNRENFVRLLERFKEEFGDPPNLLGFYLFESALDMPWMRPFHTDYSAETVRGFRDWLERRYGSLEAFNARQRAPVASFGQVQAPVSPEQAIQAGYGPSFWNDWMDYRFAAMAEFAAWAREQVRRIFGEEKIFYLAEGLTASYAANDPNVTGANAWYGIDERLRARAADAIGVEGTYDYMSNHTRIVRAAADFDRDGLPDIPVWMDYYIYSWQPEKLWVEPAPIPALRMVDILGAGATGTVLEHTGSSLVEWENGKVPAERVGPLFDALAEVNRVRSRYAGLFAQARVPADVALILPTWQLRYDPRYRAEARAWDQLTAGVQHLLQRNQRQIQVLYADEPLPEDARTLVVPLGERTSQAFIEELKQAVAAGARAYVEGPATLDAYGQPAASSRLAELVGATVASGVRRAIRLPDGRVVNAQKPHVLRDVQGEVLASFTDGSPAIVRHAYGQGEVIYAPSLIANLAHQEAWQGAVFDLNFPEAYRAYYAWVADRLGPGVATVRGAAEPGALRVHVLDTDRARLVLLTNWSEEPQTFELALEGAYGAARDLRSDQPLPVAQEGGTTTATIRLDGYGWGALALGASEEALAAALAPQLPRLDVVATGGGR